MFLKVETTILNSDSLTNIQERAWERGREGARGRGLIYVCIFVVGVLFFWQLFQDKVSGIFKGAAGKKEKKQRKKKERNKKKIVFFLLDFLNWIPCLLFEALKSQLLQRRHGLWDPFCNLNLRQPTVPFFPLLLSLCLCLSIPFSFSLTHTRTYASHLTIYWTGLFLSWAEPAEKILPLASTVSLPVMRWGRITALAW